MAVSRRYRLDDMRRFASALAVQAGVASARASALATHLLWFDAAATPAFGVASLPDLLERIVDQKVDPSTEGTVVGETAGTAVFDGQNGLPPLILSRAGQLATEKARDVGIGLVRVTGIGPVGPVANLAAEMAVGPWAGVLIGGEASWAMALPTDEGLPVVFGSGLGSEEAPDRTKSAARSAPRPAPIDLIPPWASALVPEGGWLVAAIGIHALEPLETFQERVGFESKRLGAGAGRLLPDPWDAHRREARESGITLTAATWKKLDGWAKRLGVERPQPHAGPRRTAGTP